MMGFIMKLNYKHALVAVALAGAFSTAQTAAVSLTEADFDYNLGANPTDANSYNVSHYAGSFSDVYLCSLTQAADTIASAISLYRPCLNGTNASYDINNQSIALFSDPDGDGAAGVNTQVGTTVFYNDE